MPNPVDVQVVGAGEAFRDLDRIVDRIDHAAALESRRHAERLVTLVVPKLPRGETGRLARSFVLVDESTAGYDGSAPYAGWIEYGGSRSRPYVPGGRYLYPTATGEADAFERELEQAAEHEIARYSWSTPR